ncbi:restriction endonuclease subunit S [Desulfobacter vibrioformis]|uniref:restriction endonuclease subunit S n=1 Tax=Desulfobacter vibrioformis TaxID=34031 RepID=UPI000551748C|nr:restriction endonuclease subunit S [Desulfobacter vibrioformis]
MTDFLPVMPRYEAYKDSGVAWIGEIPKDWNIEKIKYLFKIGRGRVISQEELEEFGLYPVYSSQTRDGGLLGFINSYDYNCKQITWTTDGANAGTVFLREGKHNCTNVCGTLQAFSKNLSMEYLSFALGVGTLFYKRPDTNGAKIMSGEMAEIKVPSPPFQEQTSIANFLNCKTTKIDQAVAIKEKQIRLLKERKQILIQNAVTKGLDPNVPMADSGVEWIGQIPAHWQVKRAKYLFIEVDERSTTGKEELLSVSHMTGVTPRSEKNVNMFMAEDYTGSKTCRKNDLVFNIMWTWMGALGVSDRSGIVSSSYGIFRQQKDGLFNSNYLEFLLKTTKYIEHYNKVSTGLHSSRLRFYGHMFFNMEIGFPDRKEQDQIVTHIQTQSTKIDQAIAIQEQMIEKLKEYKATLINSAVTGKIKVPDPAENKVVA